MIGYRMHGYTIVAAQPAGIGDHYVILARGEKPEAGNRFVTALVHISQIPTPDEWWSGHYVDDPEIAIKSYYDRATTMPLSFSVATGKLLESLAENEWVHVTDGTPCIGDDPDVPEHLRVSEEVPNLGICLTHDRRVRRRVPR